MENITVQEVKDRLDNGEDFCFIDVREVWEYEEDNIGAQNIPLAEIMRPKRLADYCGQQHLIGPKEYKYPHDYENQFIKQDFLPKKLIERNFTSQQIMLKKRASENPLKPDGEINMVIKFFSKRMV